MIFDTIDNILRYSGLAENLPAALSYLLETDLASLPVGRIDVPGDKFYVLVQEFNTKPTEQTKWEAHRNYIDVQYVLSGKERMGFANLSTMQLGEYNSEKDFQAMSGTGNFVDVFAGFFVIFFPEDGHMPCLCVDQPEAVRKVVLKVKCAE